MPNRLARYVVFRELIDQGTYDDVVEEGVDFGLDWRKTIAIGSPRKS